MNSSSNWFESKFFTISEWQEVTEICNRSWVIVERRYDLSLRTNAAYKSFSRDVVGRGICNLTAS